MTDILDEVIRDEAENKKYELIKKYTPVVFLLVLLSVAGAFMYNWRLSIDQNVNSKITKSIIDLAQESILKPDSTEDSFNILVDNLDASSHDQIIDLGHLMEVMHLLKDDKTKKQAMKALENILDARYSVYVRNYARMLWMFEILGTKGELSEDDHERLMEYFEYFNNEDMFCYGQAGLAKAYYLVKNGKIKKAKIALRNLQGSDIDPQIKYQVKVLLNYILNN